MPKVDWRWWEVQLSEGDDYTVITYQIVDADVDRDEDGLLIETCHFIESDAFVVVKTVTDEPLDAIRRALELLKPNILEGKENVRWANIGC